MLSQLPSPIDLQYFLEVGHTLNISRASERLGISQPSLSLAIQRLEQVVGVPLLLRNKSGVRLTRSGLKLFGQTRGLLDEWERIRSESLRDEAEVSGRFTLGCHPAVAMYTLPHFLPRLLSDHPALEIKLIHDMSRRINEDVISFKIDFGLVINPTSHPDLVIRSIARDHVTLWVCQNPTPAQDPTNSGSILAYDPDLLQSQHLLKQFVRRKWIYGRSLTSSNLDVIVSLVAAGAAAGILPTRVATRSKLFGLKIFAPDAPHYTDELCLIYRADANRSHASKAIIQAIEKSAPFNERDVK